MPKPLRRRKQSIGIVGSRRRDTWEDFEDCVTQFDLLYREGDLIISGGCPKGGDRFAELIALMRTPCFGEYELWELSRQDRRELIEEYNAPIRIFDADWNKLGRGAGFVRNTDIARESDILIAVVAPDRTGGTEDTVKKATNLGKKVYLV